MSETRLSLPRKQRGILVALLAIQASVVFCMQGLAILTPAFLVTYHLTNSQGGTLVSAVAIGGVFGSVAIGAGLDWSRSYILARMGLLAALILFAIAGGIVRGYVELLLSLLLLGSVLPIFGITGLHAITRYYSAQYVGMLLGFRQGVILVGSIMAAALFPELRHVSFRGVIGGLGILMVLVSILLVLILSRLHGGNRSGAIQEHKMHMASSRALLPIVVVVLLIGAGQFSVLVFGVLYLGKLGIHATWVGGAALALFLSGGFCVRVAAGFLVGRYVPLKKLLASITLVGCITMLIWGTFAFRPSVWMILGVAFILGTGIVGYNALPFQWASEVVTQEQKGQAMGLVSAVASLAVALWLPLFGVTVDNWGYSAMWCLVAALFGTATVVVVLRPNPPCEIR